MVAIRHHKLKRGERETKMAESMFKVDFFEWFVVLSQPPDATCKGQIHIFTTVPATQDSDSLVSIADDYRVRCWREGPMAAISTSRAKSCKSQAFNG